MSGFKQFQRGQWAAAAAWSGIVLGGALMVGCSKAEAQRSAPPPPEVTVLQVAAETVPVYREYPARTYARDMVEVRGRVDGYIERRSFAIG